MVAIYTTGGVSGGHLNPAISIALSVFRGFPARQSLIYIAAQLLGAITAGGFAYAIYHDAIIEVAATEKVPQSLSVASEALITAPKPFVHPATAFFTEFMGSAILVGAIMALGDDGNAPPGAGMNAFILGVLISIVILAFGYNTGGYANHLQALFKFTGTNHPCLTIAASIAPEILVRDSSPSWQDGEVICFERPTLGGFGVLGVQTSAAHYLAHLSTTWLSSRAVKAR